MTPEQGTPAAGRRRPRRKRVVLADRYRTAPMSRTIMELEEQTSVGEMVVGHLVRAQLRSALVLTGLVAVGLFGLPLLFYLLPSLGDAVIFGVRLPWLALGVLPYPFMVLVGYWYSRSAARHERDFLHMIER
ncbi:MULTISPECIES: hypothetical protein [unclassified Saccharopolyspora]|uniref:hypothetical protein n=1 Tax=Saccharopolyspora TaxID=1835 RepID=UPI00190B2682|nr:hypothetical protein [Saccharopolyspora sp. HNM0986]MBK0865381.1 hypothetical protein [Saccharopolyspora sp. HNM0986]